jgi:hypothetical protein
MSFQIIPANRPNENTPWWNGVTEYFNIPNILKTGEELVTYSLKTLASPVLVNRPVEVTTDVLSLFSPFPYHTERCINYIKRCIRSKVLFSEKKSGVISFKVDPKEGWLFDPEKVDRQEVLDKVNEWLQQFRDSSDYPRRVNWVDAPLLRSKVTHGDKYIVYFFEPEETEY